MDRDIHRHQPCLFYFLGRTRLGKALWGKLCKLQSQRPALGSALQTMEGVSALTTKMPRHEKLKKKIVTLSLRASWLGFQKFSRNILKQKERTAFQSNSLLLFTYHSLPITPYLPHLGCQSEPELFVKFFTSVPSGCMT